MTNPKMRKALAIEVTRTLSLCLLAALLPTCDEEPVSPVAAHDLPFLHFPKEENFDENLGAILDWVRDKSNDLGKREAAALRFFQIHRSQGGTVALTRDFVYFHYGPGLLAFVDDYPVSVGLLDGYLAAGPSARPLFGGFAPRDVEAASETFPAPPPLWNIRAWNVPQGA